VWLDEMTHFSQVKIIHYYTHNKLKCVKKACFMCLFSTICGVKVEFILRCKVYFEGGEGKLVRAIILYRE
jgi:hypothetical protein